MNSDDRIEYIFKVKGEAVMNEEDVDMTLPMDHTFHTEIEIKD
ncbi:MAG: hypothetical protein ACE5I1_02250 [bacterium]